MYAANVGIVRSLGFITAALAQVLGLLACGQTSDPSVPCERIALGEAIDGAVAAHADSPVIAISDTPKPYVVHPVCSATSGCKLVRTYLDVTSAEGEDPEPLTGGSALLVTSTGKYVVAIDGEERMIRAWKIDPWASPAVGAPKSEEINHGREDAVRLVASLRNSDTIVVRNDAAELGSITPNSLEFYAIAPDRPELKVVAVGDQFIVGREIVDGAQERVVLLPVTDDAPGPSGPLDLAVVPALSRIEITADDEFVVATAGEGDDAETFVFSIPDGVLVDRFLGGAVTGPLRLDALPGLRAVSPDGTHLAYRTSSGALALRDLQASTSCLVRSSTGGDHSVAGFTADAMLYMQADHSLGTSHIFAFDTRASRLTALDPDDRGHHLVGAPPRLEHRSRPWAIGVRDGSYSAVQADAPAASLGLEGPVLLPRVDDESALWLADRYEDDTSQARVGLRRFVPRLEGRAFEFTVADDDDSVPHVFSSTTSEKPLAAGLTRLTPGERPCLATGTPGGWAYQCGSAVASQGFFAAAPMPGSEGRGNSKDPEVPDLPDE